MSLCQLPTYYRKLEIQISSLSEKETQQILQVLLKTPYSETLNEVTTVMQDLLFSSPGSLCIRLVNKEAGTDLLKVDRTEILIGMLAIISPASPMLGSTTWQRSIGWSLTLTSLAAWNVSWTVAGRSVGDSVPCCGDTVNMLQMSRAHSTVGSSTNLHTVSLWHEQLQCHPVIMSNVKNVKFFPSHMDP